MPTELPYTVLDVFAEQALEGNPLAVFHDARGLSDAQMQALARETNLSETTFVLPGDPEQDRVEGVRVRIFTTQEELPFAGHPTLGTATWLRLNHPALRDADEVTLRLNVGPIPVHFDRPTADPDPGLYGSMRQQHPVFGAEYDAAVIAPVLGLEESDLLPATRPQIVSTGNAFCVVALRSVEVLERLSIPQQAATAWLEAHGARWFYCIAPQDNGTWRARMQWYGGEDPATGSAAGPCVAWLVRIGLVAPETPVTLLQGVEMLRPSRLTVQAGLAKGKVIDVHVAGRTIPVATGRFFLPV